MTRREKLVKRFEIFHEDNPRIYELFQEYTLRAINRGFKVLSADMVVHRIRWETQIETVRHKPDDEFKICNDFVAFYSRMFMRDHPKYDGFFRTRDSAADDM